MTLHIVAEPTPLTPDQDGVIRVNGTRVTLATVVTAFHQGVTAETIVQQYPSLSLNSSTLRNQELLQWRVNQA